MTDRLKLPSEWADQYLRQHHPELLQPSEFESTRLRLSVDPRRDYGFDLTAVANDLRNGVVVDERTGRDETFYVLLGTYHRVFAVSRFGEESRVPIARVTSIKDGSGFGRQNPVRPRDVAFTPLWDEEFCDLDALTQSFFEALDLIRRRKVAWDGVGNGEGPQEISAHGLLQGRVRARYRPLQAVFKLLRARSALTGQIEVTATVIDADNDRVELELSYAAKLSEDRLVTVHIGDAQYNVQLLALDGKACEVPQPRVALLVGQRIRIVQRDRFAMAKHSAALGTFLRSQVEGNWDHLAAILTSPESLRPARPNASIQYLSGVDLNKEQQAAVARALATPHAFLIQGPPGTGKTTVIMELILQMVTRGERVLLLAPMHVAVDEVLRRIGDRPEVFPIRLAYDDAKVSEDLQRFLLSRINGEYLQRARTPATSKAEQWRRQLERLTAERQRVLAHAQAADALTSAVQPEARSAESYRAWESWFQTSWATSSQRLQAAQKALDGLSTTAPVADRKAVALRAQVAAAPAGQRLRSWFRRLVGRTDELGQLRTAASTATAEAAQLADAQRRRGQEHDAVQAALTKLGAARDSRGRELYSAWQQDRRRLEAAEQALRQAMRTSGLPADVAPHGRLAGIDAQVSVLGERIRLEQRWFELVQPEDPDRLAKELRQART